MHADVDNRGAPRSLSGVEHTVERAQPRALQRTRARQSETSRGKHQLNPQQSERQGAAAASSPRASRPRDAWGGAQLVRRDNSAAARAEQAHKVPLEPNGALLPAATNR